MRVELMSVAELNKIIESNSRLSEYVIIDLRDREDYMNGHIWRAINIPFEKFMKISDYSKLVPAKKNILVYCVRGGSSIYAAHRLREKGYNVRSLIGGMMEYEKYGQKNIK